MSDALHELRPRSPVELYDAALHLCVHTQSELPTLALLGAAPVAGLGLYLAREAHQGRPYEGAALAFCLALVLRNICQGAGALAATRELEGRPISALTALGEGLRRLPSFVTATLWLGFFNVALFGLSLGLSVFFVAAQGVGPALIAEGSAHGWNFGRIARERLRGRAGAASTLKVLHGLALVFLFFNLHTGLALLLMVAHGLFGVDVSYVDRFASLNHAFYDLALLAVADALLDPVRCATSALLLADARVRHEGFDLLAALRRVREALPSGQRAAALLLALGAALWAGPARADLVDADDEPTPDGETIPAAPLPPGEARAELDRLARELGVGDASGRKGLERLRKAKGPEAEQLSRLVSRIRRVDEAGMDDQAREELRAALEQAGQLATPSATPADPRAAAQQILNRPEFGPEAERRLPDPKEPEPAPDWWDRFWKWLGKLLDKLFDDDKPHHSPDMPGPSLNGGGAELLTYGLVGLAAVIILIAAVQAWRHRRPLEPDAGAGAGVGSGDNLEGEVNALSRPAAAWSDEADRLAAQGRFREAVRALYLALLNALHRRGAIDYHPALSNWDYCTHFRGAEGELAPFRELTRRFDFAWYGRLGADAEGYGQFKALVGPLLAGEVAPHAHAPKPEPEAARA